MFPVRNVARMDSFKDELSLAAGKVTPGVDDSPYIQYALNALTRDREGLGSEIPGSLPPSEKYTESSAPRQDPGLRAKDFAPLQSSKIDPFPYRSQNEAIHHQERTAPFELPSAQEMSCDRENQALLPRVSTRYPNSRAMGQSQWVAVGQKELQKIDPRGRTYRPLTFKPRILRLPSMIGFVALSVLMIVGLIFSAIHSEKHYGLTPYPGSIYSGQYFVFRILPQLLAGVILIYAQNIVTASLRIAPFAALAKEDPQRRYLALFQSLYPKTFLLPQLSGPWQLKAFGIATWLMNFTVPLQSAAFTVINQDKESVWRWATSSGVIWTLVALYIVLSIATLVLMVFWFGQWTGLAWDVRCIADLLPLLHRSNTIGSYRRKDLCEHHCDFKAELSERWFDRLGYWQTEDMTTGGIWHTIGTSALSTDTPAASKRSNNNRAAGWIDGTRGHQSNKLPNGIHQIGSSAILKSEGESYLPPSLTNLALVTFALVTGSLVVALLIVSFLPQTRLETGFAPLVVVKPDSSAFSCANFLYSFLPAALGMVLFIVFQSLDKALRMLQPWADMSGLDGAPASRSILADYAACLPFQAPWKALSNGHWRVAVISLMSTLFIFIPILAGGLFMALTTPSGQVRMFPSMPVFGVLLAFLLFYVGCLCILMPCRQQFRLPHPVETIASIISFCTAQELCADSAFRSVRSRNDLMDRLGVSRADRREESVWIFGLLAGRDEKCLSVRRMRRYTEKIAVMNSVNTMV
ncbi:hypothetical protein E4U32_004846 [Claviceps aff. humidiphila group G2b]|nr:hypothetical protein E4U32_004846 [Claviceps aff. humidiphila group G2b]KAG6106031.1 hypothetical protein E4U31_001054 [Claviceps sp. LM219 group G6]KAG6110389.1 hypothetical protein E4U14_002845 [Claviceps sp. LM454 group G7]